MRRIVVTGLIVFSALTLSMVGGAADQRTRGIGAALTRTPTQVEVTNFPAVQGVAGAVNVGNLPAVQNVVGTVAVSNLPIDADGNLRVSGPVTPAPSLPRLIGITQSVFVVGIPILTLSHACDGEFPGTRLCEQREILKAIPAPPTLPGQAVLVMFTEAGTPIEGRLRSSCVSSAGELFDCGSGPWPVACCGF